MFFQPEFLDFFIELAPNNHKDWFDEHRTRYENYVKLPFRNFVEHMILEMGKIDPVFKGLEAKDCIFRINRDIRFSKDKTPYKTNLSAVIAPEGKKSKAINGIYFELGPEKMSVYAGVYEADKDDIYFIREGIATQADRFRSLYSAPEFIQVFGTVKGEKNKIIPKEFQAAAEKEPLLFNKQWYFYRDFEPETIFNKDLDAILIDCYMASRPLDIFFNELIKK